MSSALEIFTLWKPNPNPSISVCSKRTSVSALDSSPASVRFRSIRSSGLCTLAVSVYGCSIGLARGLVLSRSNSRNRLVFWFAASHEESPSDIEIQEEVSRLKDETEESEEAWKQTLASFKEQALKMQSISEEAYEVYAKKAMVVLKETSEQLKILADKTREDLNVIAKELSEEGKVYMSMASENSPESVKVIVEAFASLTDGLKDLSKVHDFYVGIPYGALLSLGGFFSFMITGNISAIRFGMILGGANLALSIYGL